MKNNVFIIAEMSANHCGDRELAKGIIRTAKEAGADAVKIQTYTAETITLNCRNEEFFIRSDDSLWKGEYLFDLYQKAYTPWEWQAELKQYADELGIRFFSTPFDYTAVDFLESIDVPMYKIASFEAYDFPLIKYAERHGKPMIISVGVSSLDEIQEAVDACKSVGNSDITLLKCTSAYPARLEDMNILTVQDMIRRFGRSLYVARDIKKGETFTPQNVRSVRPSLGLHPRMYETVLGRKACQDIAFGTLLREDQIMG